MYAIRSYYAELNLSIQNLKRCWTDPEILLSCAIGTVLSYEAYLARLNMAANTTNYTIAGQQIGKTSSSVVLRENLEVTGFKAPPNTAAHHMVAANDSRAIVARSVLQREGIDINEAVNGVFLPENLRVANPPNLTHSTIHTNLYYETINTRLSNAAPGTIRLELCKIREEILNGTFPY